MHKGPLTNAAVIQLVVAPFSQNWTVKSIKKKKKKQPLRDLNHVHCKKMTQQSVLRRAYLFLL